jgi:hypothetical protein
MTLFTLKPTLQKRRKVLISSLPVILVSILMAFTSTCIQAQTSTLILTETHTNIACNGGSTGSVTISASGGIAPYTGIGTFDNLTAGTYLYKVTDAQDFSKEISVTITEPDPIIATALVTQPKCVGEIGKVQISLTGGDGNSCTWSGGMEINNSFAPIANNSFSNGTNFIAGSAPQGIASGDLDGDGIKDLVVVNYMEGTISVYRNISITGSFDENSLATKVNFSVGGSPYDVVIDDIDGDGKNDILVTNSSTNTISAFRNISSPGSFDANSLAAGVDFVTPDTPLFISVADIDGDGKKDMVVSSISYNSLISVFRNTSTPGDLSVSSFAAGVSFSTNFNPHGIAIEDVDGDGKLDIAVTNYGENTVSVFKNTSVVGEIMESSLQQKVDFVTGAEPFTLSIADIDGDGKKDMIVACPGNNTLSVLQNVSTQGVLNESSFTEKIDLTTGSFPMYISLSDMDGDAKKDIVLTNPGDNTFSFFKNVALPGIINGNSFNAKQDFAAGNNSRGLTINDFDGDGNNDIAVTNNADNTISVFLKSNSNCSSPTSYTLAAGSSYNYMVTDGNGCSSNAISGIIDAPSAIEVSADITPSACSGESIVVVTATGGTPPYSGTGTFTKRADVYPFIVTDANGCTGITWVWIDQPVALTATCLNSNPVLYFGYAEDQSTTISVQPSGGAGPYNISVTMNRPLNCNMIDSSGDEVWTPGANTYDNTYVTCPSNGTLVGNPVSKATISEYESYTVNLTLMEDADITATVTDANGCTYQYTSHVHAEDVRCFAKNSNIQKTTLCHKTGSSKNPCVTLCVDQSAVAEHLAHGDFVGKCTPNCIAPAGRPAATELPIVANELTVKVTPNPTMNYFNVNVTCKNDQPVTIKVMDIYGRMLQLEQKIIANSTLRLGQKLAAGSYLIEVLQGDQKKIVKVIKAN